MKALRVFVFDIVAPGCIIGWILWRYPEALDSVIPWLALGVLWHLTLEVLEARLLKRKSEALYGRWGKRPMTWLIVFCVGGLISIGYWYSIRFGINQLAALALKEKAPTQKTDAQPPKTAPQGKKPCHPETSQFDNCTEAEILDWGKPVLERLQEAIQENFDAAMRRHEEYRRNHKEAVPEDIFVENAQLNRYLEADYKNLVIYRAALLSKLKGGDPTGFDPLTAFERFAVGEKIVLLDKDSNLSMTKIVFRDLQELSDRLAQQVAQESVNVKPHPAL